MANNPPNERHIETTADGSRTLRVSGWDEPYHSSHGALQESRHVFINMGFLHCPLKDIRVLEMGFGTGLNAYLTLLEANRVQRKVTYTAVEAYPVTKEEAVQLNYPQQIAPGSTDQAFEMLHALPWEQESILTPHFTLLKKKCDFREFKAESKFDLLYYDAFGARVQPELWTEVLFEKMYKALAVGGILVTYAAKGSVRRAMVSVGFSVERLPGPPGKREMLRATKIAAP